MSRPINAVNAKPRRQNLTRSEKYGIVVYYVCGVAIKDIERVFDASRSAIHRIVKASGVEADRYPTRG